MKHLLNYFIPVAVVLGMAAPAQAVSVFSDDFNRGNSHIVGNGWGEAGGARIGNVDGVNPIVPNDVLLLFHTGSGGGNVSRFGIDLMSFSSVNIGFDYFRRDPPANYFENNDLVISWRVQGSGASGWTEAHIINYASVSSSTAFFAALTGAAGNVIDLLLATTPESTGRGVFVDNFVLSGVSAVPLPAALPMLAVGLGLLGAAGARRRKQHGALVS